MTLMEIPQEAAGRVVTDLPEQDYHSHPALSHSGSKKLLPPYCPALFRWEQENPPEPKAVFDFGTAAHKLVLGVGCELVEVEANDWRTNAAKEARDEARARGAVPLLSDDMRVVEAMALALRRHPIASALLQDDAGTPEASLFWRDDETGVALRGRLDYLPNSGTRSRLLIADYKTCASAHPSKFAKSAADYGYHSQAAWYLDGAQALGLGDDAAFLFIAQEKTPPYLVSVIELDAEALTLGRSRNRDAIDLYAACVAADTWPGYADDVVLVSLPRWAA